MKKLITMLTFILLGFIGNEASAKPSEKSSEQAVRKQTVARQGTVPTTRGVAANFTGVVTVETIYVPAHPSKTYASYVTFEPGARTNWHSHPLGQTLIVTDGIAWTQDEFGNTNDAHVGDVIHCPPDIKHWHGASADVGMTHVSISERHETASVIWLSAVTNEQYEQAKHTIEKH